VDVAFVGAKLEPRSGLGCEGRLL